MIKSIVLGGFLSLTLHSLYAADEAQPPDLTSGSQVERRLTYNLGSTGMRGWIYTHPATYLDSLQGRTTAASRQILVTHVGDKSPADGVMKVDDVILGVGKKPFSDDARKSIALAIQEAEKDSNKGILTLTRWRAGKTEEVQLKLRVMGTYSDTAPYNCPKSKRIFEEACKALEKEPLEIGRIRVFTPGWLENESIWLHMEYKFLLEILKAGLYGEFYKDFKSALIPFQPAARYGRSILENSSFLASSVFFDKGLRGNGFVARLSGATAEFLNILLIMNLGNEPFKMRAGSLIFSPSPILDKIFFTLGHYTFNIFQNTFITYNNPKKQKTFGSGSVKPVSYKLRYVNGKKAAIAARELGEPFSTDLRSGVIESVLILLD